MGPVRRDLPRDHGNPRPFHHESAAFTANRDQFTVIRRETTETRGSFTVNRAAITANLDRFTVIRREIMETRGVSP